ncbi:MAG: hypothetical protein BJ554DRAFT_4694 [Olpidium bornovanus]|uniref:Uncharacterized protein n=1 Tax=Olpidium bornovanus TaxID=278681 RepID=A0A8H7ZMM9_9FUNG|nr:MAG: hypothetical protein BJ554DRAFT_4694 [Olpidium bornovanus]
MRLGLRRPIANADILPAVPVHPLQLLYLPRPNWETASGDPSPVVPAPPPATDAVVAAEEKTAEKTVRSAV